MVGCATDGTVSVSTVMLRNGGSRVLLELDSEDNDGLVDTVFGRCVEAVRCSCILPFLPVLLPLSLPLSVLFEGVVVLRLLLRSSVTLDELTSCLSSSVTLCVDDEEMKLAKPLTKSAVRAEAGSVPLLAATCVAMTKSGAAAGTSLTFVLPARQNQAWPEDWTLAQSPAWRRCRWHLAMGPVP